MLPKLLTRLFSCAFLASTLLAQTNPPLPSSLFPPTQPAAPSTTVAASFWNLQWFPGRRPNASRAEENRQVRAVHRDMTQLVPDVLGLEEVRDSAAASVAIKPLSGFKIDVCSQFPPREGQNDSQQIAIASRLQPISAWAEAWKPGAAITPPRGFAVASYKVAPKQILLVYAVHLKSNRGEIREDMRIREESMRQLLSHMKAMRETYGKMGALTWIVGGDFNTSPDERRFTREKTVPALLADGFGWAWHGVPELSRFTVLPNARYPAACFDHIFYQGATLSQAWVTNTSPQSSDHRAVNVVLNLP